MREDRGMQPSIDRRYLLTLVAIAAIYFVAARGGLSLAFVAQQVTAVWPPTGIALAMLLLMGYRAWPGIALGAFLINAVTNEPPATALGIAVGNTLEAVLGALLLRRLVGFQTPIERLRDVAGLVVFAAALSTITSATIGVTSLCLGGVVPWKNFGSVWWIWWVGDAMGDLVVAPLLLTWSARPHVKKTRRQITEIGIVFLALLMVGYVLFVGHFVTATNIRLEYIVFPFMMWIAIRFGQRETATAIFLISSMAIWGAMHDLGPFAQGTFNERLILLEAFMAAVAVAALALGALTAERKRAEKALRESEERYRVVCETEQAARAQAEASERRSALLAEAGKVLVSSLDYETTLKSIVDLAVPSFADWCIIDVVEETGEIKRVAVAAVRARKQEILCELQQLYPPDQNSPQPAAQALRSGQSILFAEFDQARLAATCCDEKHLKLVQELDPKATIAAPLVAHGRTLGIITFSVSESGRRYAVSDVPTAEELARSAALAVANARLYREAQAANRAKDEFLAVLSHELRTPLTPILGWARLLRSGKLDSASSSYGLEVIERNAKTQSQLVEDLLEVSRIITGHLRLEVRPIDLVGIIQAAIEAVQPALDVKNITLERALDSATGPVLGDAARLQQVVANLLSNASKFTPRNGHIVVRLEKTQHAAKIMVSDNGEGISPEFLPQVFDRFKQANATSTRYHGGLGLGLAIVRHLVEQHSGAVQADSPGIGKGATFTVTLPLAPVGMSGRGASEQAAALRTSQSAMLDGLRVLLIEDDPDTRELISFLLERQAAQVRSTESARGGLELIAGWKPDLIISDIGLPDEDGYFFIDQVRKLSPGDGGGIPAMALTAYAKSEDGERLIAAGFQKHVTKPVDPAEFIRVVAHLAGRSKTSLQTLE